MMKCDTGQLGSAMHGNWNEVLKKCKRMAVGIGYDILRFCIALWRAK